MKHQSSPNDSNGSFCCSDEHIQHFNWGAMYSESLYDIPNLIRLVIQGMVTPLPTVHHHLPIGCIGSETMVNQWNQHIKILIHIISYHWKLWTIYGLYIARLPNIFHQATPKNWRRSRLTCRLLGLSQEVAPHATERHETWGCQERPSSPVGSWLSQRTLIDLIWLCLKMLG